MTKLNSYSLNHHKITGDFAEHLVMYCLSKDGYECAHVQHVGIDIIAAKEGKLIGVSVKGRSRKPDKVDVGLTINKPKQHISHVRVSCQHFGCEGYFAFVMDQESTIKVILVPLSTIESYYNISDKSSQDWNTEKFAADPEAIVFKLAWI